MTEESAPATRDKERTRRAVLDAARRVLADRGSGASVAEIATAAGVSKGGLLHHFGSREELVREVAREGLEWFRAEVVARVDLAENRPGKLLRAYVRALCADHPDIVAAFTYSGIWGALSATPGVDELFADDEQRWRHDFGRDGLDPDRTLVVRYGAEGVAAAIGAGAIDDAGITRVREALLALTET